MMKKALALFLCLTILVPVCPASADSEIPYKYDANGNLVSGDGKYFEYNDANKLVRVRLGDANGAVLAEYVYDHAGQRIKKIENGLTTYYVGKLYEEEYTAGQQTGKASYFFANGQRVAKKDNTGKMLYFHADHLGGTNVVTDESGNQVERTKYYPFGDIREGGNERYSFTGKEKDKATDFYYFEARHYNPGYRHFTQADTIVPKVYDPQSLNRYAYVKNNPLKYIDPSGNEGEETNMIPFKKDICEIHKERPQNVRPVGKLTLIKDNVYKDENNRIWFLQPDTMSTSHQRMLNINGVQIDKKMAEKMIEEGKPLPNKKFISMTDDRKSSYEAITKNLDLNQLKSDTLVTEWYDEKEDGGPSFNLFQPSGKADSLSSFSKNLFNLNYSKNDFYNDIGHGVWDMSPYDICK